MHFVRALETLEPKAFVFENVPGIKSANGGPAYDVILSDFRRAGRVGYEIVFSDVVDLSKMGVPQERRGFIVIGIRRGLVENLCAFWEAKLAIERALKGSDLLSEFPLTPIEVFEGRPLSELQDRYREVMEEWSGVWFRRISNT